MTQENYPIHPAADLFPMMSDEEFKGLKEDIKKHGQRDFIMLWKGRLVDGRNRLRACNELGIEPDICEMAEDIDPWQYVVSHNLHRRHLDTSQRAMVADKLATMRRGEKKADSGIPLSPMSQADAAEKLNVSTDSIKKARKIRKNATPEVVAAVESGTMSLNAAVETTQPKTPAMEPPQEKKSLTVHQICHTLYRMSKEKKRRPQIMQIINEGLQRLTSEERIDVLSSQLFNLSPEDLGKVYDDVELRQQTETKKPASKRGNE